MKIFYSLVAFVIIVGAGSILIFKKKTLAPAIPKSSSVITTVKPASFDKTKYSIDSPGSIWWIVNKKRPLPSNYVPNNLIVPDVALRLDKSAEQMHLSSTIAGPLKQMFDAASVQGYKLMLASGYRSVAYQKQLYDGYVAKDGQTAADKYSAIPGTSEHQTGFALDVGRVDHKCELDQCFGSTPEGIWLATHAYEYGFIIRYTQGKETITTYEYEPWHLRYVGTDLAAELHKNGLTMEEFFGLN